MTSASQSVVPNSVTGDVTVWVQVLVDSPGAQGLYTYSVPDNCVVRSGDILTVPFGTQLVGGIALQLCDVLPNDLDPSQIKPIDAVMRSAFFPPVYWALLERVATYYYTPLMQVVRAALPPRLLAKSQRRVRLLSADLPDAAQLAELLSPMGLKLLQILQNSKTGDYAWQFLQRQKIKGLAKTVRELTKVGLVETFFEPPQGIRPKLQQAVTMLQSSPAQLTDRQSEVFELLRRRGGEMWLTELLHVSHASSAVVKALANKGCVTIAPQEVLRSEQYEVAGDQAKLLTLDQQAALATITGLSGNAEVLLHGVTGSGKTEVYLQAIAPLLAQGQSALVLVPEIGLTPQLTDRFRARFGDRVCVYHSALSDGERYDTWRKMLMGQPQVVIGTRSAVFAPLPNLGLIVLDEEHDSSFKQDQPAPCYHARMVAQWRSELENCPLILGSATPALESWQHIRTAPVPQRHYLSLPERVGGRAMPPVKVVDMRQELIGGNRSMFSRRLQSAIRELQATGKQGILFIHRRGYSTHVSCRSCGFVMECPHCDVSLSHHQTHPDAMSILRCHYCGYTQAQPSRCPSCDSTYLKHFGSGTQKVIQELKRLFPELRMLRFDSDTTRTKGAHRALLNQFAKGEADLLIGTQMLTKGIDLPQVTLVGIVSADGVLHLQDFRASERAFQTLLQVAGRAGRGDEPGQVILQTYTPEHPVVEAVVRQNYAEFVTAELGLRELLDYPPYGRLILLRLSSPEAEAVEKGAEKVASVLAADPAAQYEILGPAPAAITRVARRYRWQIMLKFPLDVALQIPSIERLRSVSGSLVSLSIDVDPMTIL
ncbi:primosomal protein N' [filamentous cyanobacterium LEGE 11480]|uniref:Replication restart protein PriA n=2 Tax=Romeriopsis TaxID=2992131 RepID=A0A928VSF6_9CYAN|nr:primosomal protein N' [Romeriopsis navalis LEGE 11480]